jgi:hypothetical protein
MWLLDCEVEIVLFADHVRQQQEIPLPGLRRDTFLLFHHPQLRELHRRHPLIDLHH